MPTRLPPATLRCTPRRSSAPALIAAGVTVDGVALHRDSGDAPVLDSITSPPLKAIVEELLVESDNNTAELLTKRLAAAASGPGTREGGLEALRKALVAERLPTAGLTLVDGSGLDRGNRATCRLLLAALRPTTKLDLTRMLAIAGRSGTLTDRFKGHPLEGKLHAKTGALAGVVGLVGVADPEAPTPLRFAFLVNGSFSEPVGRQLQERLGAVLATYPEAPPADSIAA